MILSQAEEASTPVPDSRIIFMADVGELGGAERSCLALASWLHRRSIPCHFLAYTNDANIAQYADHPLAVVELRPRMRASKKITVLRNYLHSLPPSRRKLLASGFQPALHATLAGQRGFHTLMHDTPTLFSDGGRGSGISGLLRQQISKWQVGRGLRSGGATIVTSEFLRDDTLKFFGVKASIARMGGMATNSRFHLRPVTTQLNLLSVSRLEQNKRIDWVLRALGRLEHGQTSLSGLIDWRLDIVGKGACRQELDRMAVDLGLGQRVKIHGFLPDEQLAGLYERAHLFLMPAVQGYGIPAAEALYRGIPVLLHRESGISDILLDTPWATVIEGGEDSLAPALLAAIKGMRAGAHHATPPPPIPTEDEWAERVATLCDWL